MSEELAANGLPDTISLKLLVQNSPWNMPGPNTKARENTKHHTLQHEPVSWAYHLLVPYQDWAKTYLGRIDFLSVRDPAGMRFFNILSLFTWSSYNQVVTYLDLGSEDGICVNTQYLSTPMVLTHFQIFILFITAWFVFITFISCLSFKEPKAAYASFSPYLPSEQPCDVG